jgi:hypothetical protein
MAEERQFKGVWIDKEVWLDTRLNALEKVIYTEIDSLDAEESGCYASNKYLAEFCQCSETKISLAISKLCELGYIYTNSFNGRQRELKSRLSKNERQTFNNCEADFENLKENNIDNNIVNNIGNNKEKISKKEVDTEFESLWKRYPNKKGKESAYKSYAKARQNGTTYDEVINGLENYLKEIEVKKTATQYIKHGSTWFSQHCWQDEYVTAVEEKPNEYDNFVGELNKWLESEE